MTRRGLAARLSMAVIVAGAVAGTSARAGSRRFAGRFAFRQVDVFTSEAFRGNPLAVVIGADALTDEDMVRFSKWTNLSETSFLLRPTRPEADYRVRIFSLGIELPFAGHPTLGSCHAWLASGGQPKGAVIVQECGIGLVRVRRDNGRLAFEAPPLRRSLPVAPATLDRIEDGFGLRKGEITASRVLDGGLNQPAIMIGSRDRLLQLRPDWARLQTDFVGFIAPHESSHRAGDPDFEVRVFDQTLPNFEDPVTGSFNANVARWLIGASIAPSHYLVSQGTVLGRAGRVYVDAEGGTIWIGGYTQERIVGELAI